MPRNGSPVMCDAPDCPNEAARGTRCWTHLKRNKRGIPAGREVRGYGMSKKEKLDRAIARYANAETADEDRKATRLVEKYATAGGRKQVAAIVRQTVDEVLRQLGKPRR